MGGTQRRRPAFTEVVKVGTTGLDAVVNSASQASRGTTAPLIGMPALRSEAQRRIH
jgi:hypothetical protein